MSDGDLENGEGRDGDETLPGLSEEVLDRRSTDTGDNVDTFPDADADDADDAVPSADAVEPVDDIDHEPRPHAGDSRASGFPPDADQPRPDADDTVELDAVGGAVTPWGNHDTEEVIWEELDASDTPIGIPIVKAPPGDRPASFTARPIRPESEPSLSLVQPLDAPPAEETAADAGDEDKTAAGSGEAVGDDDDAAWHEGPSVLDEFTSDDYLAATTMEYQDLAQAVLRSETETHELHAVSATMVGMDSGVVGFEDVTGEATAEPTETGHGDLAARIITGVVLAGLFIGSLLAGGVWLMLLVAVVAVLSLGEFYAAARRVGYVPVAAFGLAGTIATMVGGWFGGPGGIAGAIAFFLMLVLLWYSVLVRRDPLENAAITVFGLVWVGGLLAFAAPIARHPDYLALLITLVLTAAFMDIGAYFIGRSVGRRKLAPVLSPKKTVEGLMGGVAVAFGVAVLASLVFEAITFTGALWLAVGVSVMAPLGDMAESMVKRSFGMKDMGSILPGHGGFLDRIDALLFVVPIAYYVYLALGYLD